MRWYRDHQWWMHVIDSAGKYSMKLKRYVKGNAPDGFPDTSGMTDRGHTAYVELKAKGERTDLKLKQCMFLLVAIDRGAFAVVVDCPEILEEFYNKWITVEDRKKYLLEILPKRHLKESISLLVQERSASETLIQLCAPFL